MNKKEAIEKLEQLATHTEFTEIDIEVAISVIEKIDEPEKVVIPQFVADRIEEYRETRFGLSLIFTIDDQTEDDIDFSKWLSADSENCEKVARAWIDGFSVDEQKLYKVLLPGVESLNRQMCMHEETREIGFADDGYNSRKYSEDDKFIRLFTEQEIKEIDERYWTFTEEVTE